MYWYNWYMHTKMQQCMQGCNLLIIRFLWAVSFDIILHMHKKIIFCYNYANNLKANTIKKKNYWINLENEQNDSLYHSLSGHYSCTLCIYLYKNNRMMQVLVSGFDIAQWRIMRLTVRDGCCVWVTRLFDSVLSPAGTYLVQLCKQQ